jgi:2-polyprenyl-3-methyl-5-hydroxy-6-metoxy-1,4-benzoquinol methylase
LDAVAQGSFYKKQLECKSGIIAWSHRSRFEVGFRLIGPSVDRLLDYGCGDGTFLAIAADRVQEAVGADLNIAQIEDCRNRFADVPNRRFCMIKDLQAPEHKNAYSVVTCMETLEHCLPNVVETVLADLVRLVHPSGKVVISVPIEIGPSFVAKSCIRSLAAWRGLSDYRHYESYSLGNSLRMIFATRNTQIERPEHRVSYGLTHSHYGFNWRALRERVRAHLDIERTTFSPLTWLAGWFSSQVWFVCRPRAESSRTHLDSPQPAHH